MEAPFVSVSTLKNELLDKAKRHEWAEAELQLMGFATLGPDWDGEGASAVSLSTVLSALRLAEWLDQQGTAPPECVYPLCDGNIILEWSYPDGVIQRIEVKGPGRGQLMTTFPDAPARFEPYTWPSGNPAVFAWAQEDDEACVVLQPGEAVVGVDPFSMAA
jgi:hypothetical protein